MQESSSSAAPHLVIAMDCRFGSKDVGLGRYTRELAKRLPSLLPDFTFVLFVQDVHEAWCRDLSSDQVKLHAAPFAPYSLGEHVQFPRLIHASNAALLFSPHFNVPSICSVPHVITVHDLILHRFPNRASFFRQLVYRAVFTRAVRSSRAIICVSAFTKKELLELEGKELESRSTVILEAASSVFSPRDATTVKRVLEKYGIASPYFLYVGNAKQHKNLPLLLNAFSSLPSSSPSLVLVTGGKEAEHLSLPNRAMRIPSLSDDDLASVYSGATAFVSASLSEGFGLPIVEAQACGCPVIAVNAGSIPEVASSSAILVPAESSALTRAMMDVQTKPKPSPMSSRSWDTVAQEVANVLSSSLLRFHG